MKITGQPAALFKEQKESYFDNYGIGRNQIRLIGLVEVVSAVLLLFWATQYGWLSQLSMVALMCVTVGAMYFHNRYDSLVKDGLPAIIQFVLNATLLGLTTML